MTITPGYFAIFPFCDLLKAINFNGIGIIEQNIPHAAADEDFQIAKHKLTSVIIFNRFI